MKALTEEEIVTAAEALVLAGQDPTQEAVRAACGDRGSFSTIHKYLLRWKAARAAAQAKIETELSEPRRTQAMTLFAGIHSDIRKEYEAELSRRVADNARRETDLEAALDNAADEAERLVQERDGTLDLLKREQAAREAEQVNLAAEKEKHRILLRDYGILEARLALAEKFMASFAGIAEKLAVGEHAVLLPAPPGADQLSA